MKFNPYDYQVFATDFIVNNSVSAVLLDMGLGKTVITLSAISELINKGQVKKCLVIAPLRVARNTWPLEIRKWDHLSHLTYSLVVGDLNERLIALKREAQIYIINTENVEWLINRSYTKFDYDMVVIDELSKFKSYSAKRFKSLLKVRKRINRIVGLSGTPCSNGLMDLWAEYRILDGGVRLGKYITHYREEYFLPDKRNQNIIFSYKLKPFADELIYKKISDITISMKAIDYLKMPKIIYNDLVIELDYIDRKVYDTLKKDMIVSFTDGDVDATNAAVLSNKLIQLSNGAIYDENHKIVYVHDKKLDALEEIIESASGKPILVVYWFKHDLKRIKSRFTCREILKDSDISDWNEGKISVGLIHPSSCSMGLNLQSGGSTLVWFSLCWSLELYEQTNARLYRQGQKETVVVHHIISKDTIDEDVIKALNKKATTQEALIEAVKARLEV